MNIIPIRDWVLVELEKQDATPAGIALPESFKDVGGTAQGEVLFVKSGYQDRETQVWVYADVKKGERVLFMRKHAIHVTGQKGVAMVRGENLMAVIED